MCERTRLWHLRPEQRKYVILIIIGGNCRGEMLISLDRRSRSLRCARRTASQFMAREAYFLSMTKHYHRVDAPLLK